MSNPKIHSPPTAPAQSFDTAEQAVAHLNMLYQQSITFLRDKFQSIGQTTPKTPQRYRAFYPQISLKIDSYSQPPMDGRLAFGHVVRPDLYSTTITAPDLFKSYLTEQIALIIAHHKVPVQVGASDTPIPIHFALTDKGRAAPSNPRPAFNLRDMFDVPDLTTTNDNIINGDPKDLSCATALAPFTAQRVDYSLARLVHYTATDIEHFQQFILFTNYQFYVEEFAAYARAMLADKTSGYCSFVASGSAEIRDPDKIGETLQNLPQMPAYHLKRANGDGITLVNIGVGPSNAKTATDHIAVLRPQAWVMLGHCAGLRNSQSLGDFVLAHAYQREDDVLDTDLPVSVPIPPLAEIQVALESAVADETALSGYELKRIMRTGTVASVGNRNWELFHESGLMHRLKQSRAIGLDMESAIIATNGFRFRVPYGTLLCVSDKPLHGELKLPGMASDFYQTQVKRHLKIGIKAMERLRDMPMERLHSRKLRSFAETAFR